MRCSTCDTENVADARFCDTCGTPLTPQAVTGPTRLLDEEQTKITPSNTPVHARSWSGPQLAPLIGAVWLIGLGILFLTKTFWPGILVLIGITSFLQYAGRGNTQQGARVALFFVGLTALFLTKFTFPGILIFLGVMALTSYWSYVRP
jgi:hypothetical protein